MSRENLSSSVGGGMLAYEGAMMAKIDSDKAIVMRSSYVEIWGKPSALKRINDDIPAKQIISIFERDNGRGYVEFIVYYWG